MDPKKQHPWAGKAVFTFPGIADGKWLIVKSNTIYNSDIIFYTWTLIIKRLKKKNQQH